MSVLKMNEWEVSSMKYMGKRLNEKGSGSVTILGTQLNKMLYLATPRMMTWGIADYVDESGKSNEKYTISLAFGQTMSKEEDEFLRKLKELENKILEDAVSNSELWWGEPMTKEVLKHMYFPFLKYPKVKGTKRDDMSKPPTLRAKLPYYNGQWGESVSYTHLRAHERVVCNLFGQEREVISRRRKDVASGFNSEDVANSMCDSDSGIMVWRKRMGINNKSESSSGESIGDATKHQ
jgi:hypothetical protein